MSAAQRSSPFGIAHEGLLVGGCVFPFACSSAFDFLFTEYLHTRPTLRSCSVDRSLFLFVALRGHRQ
jgi:hypothetical protein